MDDIIAIIIYLLIMIFGAIASTKKKKNLKPQQKPVEKSIPKPLEEVLKEFGIPIEEPKSIVIEDQKSQSDINKSTQNKKYQKIYSPIETEKNYETLEKIENEIQSLETLETTDYLIGKIEPSKDTYKSDIAYKLDENKITQTEIKSYQEGSETKQNEIIEFMLKNPQSLIIYSDILKSKYF